MSKKKEITKTCDVWYHLILRYCLTFAHSLTMLGTWVSEWSVSHASNSSKACWWGAAFWLLHVENANVKSYNKGLRSSLRLI